VICLIEKKQLDPKTFIVDYQTGAHVLHYAGHFGKLKALKVLIENYKIDPNSEDYYKLTIAHYAGRTGELGILMYLKDIGNLDKLDCFNYTPMHYSIMYAKVYAFMLLYFKYGCRFNEKSLNATLMQMCNNDGCVDIIQIMSHIEELKPFVTSSILH
jgi:hypothetical protein